MELWRRVVLPIRRAWCSVSTRVKARKNGRGLLELHNDIQTCGYEDVQIMWEMLRRTDEPEVLARHTKYRKIKCFWRRFRLPSDAAVSSPESSTR